MKLIGTKVALALLAGLLFQPPALGQSGKETLDDLLANPGPSSRYNAVHGTIRLFDSVLVYPLPDWSPKEKQANPLGATQYKRQRTKDAFRLIMVPKEETFEKWMNLYAIHAKSGYRGANNIHAREIAAVFTAGCRPSNLNIRPLQGNPRKAVLIIACGSYSNNPEQGEVAAFVLMQRGTTAVRLYREWRGPAFRSEDPAQWPVSRKTLDRVLRAMVRSRLMPAPR